MLFLPMNIWAGTVEGLKAECALLNKIGDEANKRGIKFGYHNHISNLQKWLKLTSIILISLLPTLIPTKYYLRWMYIGLQLVARIRLHILKNMPTA